MKRSADAVAAELAGLAQRSQLRTRRVVDAQVAQGSILEPIVEGRRLLNFCSNDYLGLAGDVRVAGAMRDGAAKWGAGSGAAHLVTGHTAEHHALEEELAEFTGREAALLFSTGYMANVGVITALAARGEVVLQDRLNHASLIDGARQCDARLMRYAHADAADALRIGDAQHEALSMLATDGVFSMDGDVAPLAALAGVAQRHDAWLLVDDAHGFGVQGATGAGSVQAAGLSSREVPLLVGTLGKACGTSGAFVAGDRDVIDLVLQRARSYIYTTAMPPAIAAATRASLRIMRTEGRRRDRLAQLVARFRAGASAMGLPLAASTTPIQPIAVPGAAAALEASRLLRERGFWVSAIRHPTVPAGTERLRVTLSAGHREADVDALLEAMGEVISAVVQA
jgi:8-amino-7-oxononanoate synthase